MEGECDMLAQGASEQSGEPDPGGKQDKGTKFILNGRQNGGPNHPREVPVSVAADFQMMENGVHSIGSPSQPWQLDRI